MACCPDAVAAAAQSPRACPATRPHWKFSMRTLRGYPATMTAQWCSQGPSGSTKADAEAKRLTKEAVYMILFRCLVLLTQAE